MVKNAITVFARVKPENNRKGIVNYKIHRRPKKHLNEDFLVLTAPQKFTEYIDNRPESWNFSFHRIFEHDVSQVDVFESVARPIVDSVFDGYNATIFAYGQTGSGKTYTITGDSGIYLERGILPRTLQYVFDIVRKNPENLYTVEVAYLEIYNENGYDLLLERKEREAATRLEDLPFFVDELVISACHVKLSLHSSIALSRRVTIQEDESGTMHLKNLSFRIVRNEKEALQFLLDGDTYRAISETPMNPRSSRSHCIFTIVVSVKKFGADRYSRAKLHLVDLAGSERVYKCAIQGTILTEAKHINLSLHFLEQVIVCLGQDNVSHVPYRNSLLTSILRDSLGGNCLTTMLATLSISNFNLEETISTCRFAQRVGLVKNDVNLTFELDIKSENMLLKMENEKLRRQIEELKKPNLPEVFNSGNLEYYKNLVVQRDQEISHLIDLLKKERSRKKSTVKEIPKTTKELHPQDEKCIHFPSSHSPRKIDQTSPTRMKRKHGNSLQGKVHTSPRKIKNQSPEVTRKITNPSHSTRYQVPEIELSALNLEEDNESDIKHTRELDLLRMEFKTPKIDMNVPLRVITGSENIKMKESAQSLTERNIPMPKIAKFNLLDDNQLLKVYEFKKPSDGQETYQSDHPIANYNYNKNNKSEIIELPKVFTERDTRTLKIEKLNVKDFDRSDTRTPTLEKLKLKGFDNINTRTPTIEKLNVKGFDKNNTQTLKSETLNVKGVDNNDTRTQTTEKLNVKGSYDNDTRTPKTEKLNVNGLDNNDTRTQTTIKLNVKGFDNNDTRTPKTEKFNVKGFDNNDIRTPKTEKLNVKGLNDDDTGIPTREKLNVKDFDNNDTRTQKAQKFNMKGLDNNETKKELKEPSMYQETSTIDSNVLESVDGTKKNQTTETPKSQTDRDTQTQKKKLSLVKDADNNESSTIRRKENSPKKNTPRNKSLRQEFPQNVMKMLRTSRNRPTEDRDESTSLLSKSESPRTSFKTPNILRNILCIEKNSTEVSVDCTEDERLSKPTKNNPDAKTDNIVTIPMPLTGDPDIDEEIIAFYKAKQTGSLY